MRTAAIALTIAVFIVSAGCEFDFEDDACEGNQSCSWSCGQGLCNWECTDQSNCTAECAGGGCDLECRDQASCTLDCPGGDCTMSCREDTDGDLWCPPDVDCTLQNFGNATCSQPN